MNCLFCQRECKNENSKRNHERLCKENPSRNEEKLKEIQERRTASLKTRKERGTFRNQWSDPSYRFSEETLKKFSKSSAGRVWTEEMRKNHSISMSKAVIENPESYTSSNRGRTKAFEKYGIKFQGNWELEFYEYCVTNDIEITRPNVWFPYEWNGSRKYFPDFYLPNLDVFVEVKGYETDRDRAKWRDFPKKLIVVRKKDIEDIRKGVWKGL